MNIRYKVYNLPFKHPFTISRGTKTHQPSLVVELEHFGIKGYGEAPAITYYNITVEQMISDIEAKRPFLERFAFMDPERYWHYLHHLFPSNPFLVCALDMAGWDIYGKMKKKQLHQLWNPVPSKNILTDITIGIDEVEVMVQKMKEKPWPVYKIKLGTEKDVEIIEELRKHSSAIFRIDANGGWETEEALNKINLFKDMGVELIEQPLNKDNIEGMKMLFEKSALPLIADESCVKESDVEKCNGYFHGINIKLTKCSGLTPARRMIQKARDIGLHIMVGSMNESMVGTSAMAQLLPLIDYADMDGPLLLSEDICEGLHFEYGNISYSNSFGIGLVNTENII